MIDDTYIQDLWKKSKAVSTGDIADATSPALMTENAALRAALRMVWQKLEEVRALRINGMTIPEYLEKEKDA